MAPKLTLKQVLNALGIKKTMASERPSSTTNIYSLRNQQRRAEEAMKAIMALKISSYFGRALSDQQGTSPDYQGPMVGSGEGTQDRMPGTTPTWRPAPPSKTLKPATTQRSKGGFI